MPGDEAQGVEIEVDDPVVEESKTKKPKVEKAEKSKPTFTVEQLMPHAEGLFGVGSHVLVGARSAGCFPSSPMTKERAQAGITKYLKMPVDQSEET